MALGVTVDFNAHLGNIAGQIDNMNQHLTRFERQAQSTGASLKNTFVGMAAAFSFQQVGSKLLETVVQVQNLELRLQGLSKSTQDYADIEVYLAKVSGEHHKSSLLLADSFSKLLSVEEAGSISRGQAKAILEGLSNAQSKTGATAENLGQSMVGLTQALSSGTLQWEEMKQVTEPIPGLMTKIANAAGFVGESAVGDFKKVVSQGRVTSKLFADILPIALSKYEGAAAKASENISAKYGDIENAWIKLATALEKPVATTVSTVLDAATWQLNEFVIQAKYAKYLWDSISSTPAKHTGDNGIVIDLTGRAKPPVIAAPTTPAPFGKTPEQIRAEIEKNNGKGKPKKEQLSDEQKAVNKLASEYDSLLASMQKEVALRGDNSNAAKMEYDLINSSLSGLNESQKLKLLNLAAEKDAIVLNTKAYEEYDQVIADGLELAKNQRTAMGTDQARLSQKFDGPRLDLNAGINDAMDARASGIIPDDAKLKTVLDKMGEDYNDLTSKSKDSTDKMSEYAIQAARNMESSFANFLFDPFAEGMDGLLAGFTNTIKQMVANAASAQIMESLMGKTGVKDGGGLLGMAFTGIKAYAGFANGGDHPGGYRIVGENGPELEYTGPSKIYNNSQTKALLSGGGSGDIQISTQVSVSGGGNTGDNNMAALGGMINARIREVIMTEKRPGGVLA